MSIEDNATQVRNAILDHTMNGELHADLAADEIRLESERTALKAALIGERIGTDNPLTKRLHSAESAENAAKVDPRYLEHVAKQAETVMRKNRARTRQDSAYLRASLGIALVKAEAGIA